MVTTTDTTTVCNDCGNEEPGALGNCGACGSPDVLQHGQEA